MKFSFKNSNVVILINSPQLGGAEKQGLTLAGYLQENLDCNVFVYACMNSEPSERFLDFFKEKRLKNLYTTKSPVEAGAKMKYTKIRIKLFRFALKLRRHRPDIIIPYLNKPSLIAAHCRAISGAKVTFWNNRGHEIYRNDIIERQAVAKTLWFTVNSKEAINEMVSNFNIGKNNIHFIPNFLTLSPNQDHNIGRDKSNELIIGMLAHFKEGKLHTLLLETFLELLKHYAFIRLYLVGNILDKEIVSKLKKYVEENGLGRKVFFMHGIAGESIIPDFDIAVLVSNKEGMSNSVMEYMYFKKPIICTNHSSNKYLIGEKSTFLIDNHKEELLQKLKILIDNKDIRESEGNRNYKRIINSFSLDNYVSELERMFNS